MPCPHHARERQLLGSVVVCEYVVTLTTAPAAVLNKQAGTLLLVNALMEAQWEQEKAPAVLQALLCCSVSTLCFV